MVTNSAQRVIENWASGLEKGDPVMTCIKPTLAAIAAIQNAKEKALNALARWWGCAPPKLEINKFMSDSSLKLKEGFEIFEDNEGWTLVYYKGQQVEDWNSKTGFTDDCPKDIRKYLMDIMRGNYKQERDEYNAAKAQEEKARRDTLGSFNAGGTDVN